MTERMVEECERAREKAVKQRDLKDENGAPARPPIASTISLHNFIGGGNGFGSCPNK